MTIEIFEKHPTADAYKVGAAFTEYCILAKEKRFSDAELAAEWHANEVKAWRMLGYRPEFFNADFAEKLENQGDILRRFARRPHASDGDYQ